MARVWISTEKSVKIEGRKLKILEALSLDAMSQANLIRFLQEDGYTSNNITDEVRNLTAWGFITMDGSLLRLADLGIRFTSNLEKVRAAAKRLRLAKKTLSPQEARVEEDRYMDLMWSFGEQGIMYDLDMDAMRGR